jgi:hypothetical protein
MSDTLLQWLKSADTTLTNFMISIGLGGLATSADNAATATAAAGNQVAVATGAATQAQADAATNASDVYQSPDAQLASGSPPDTSNFGPAVTSASFFTLPEAEDLFASSAAAGAGGASTDGDVTVATPSLAVTDPNWSGTGSGVYGVVPAFKAFWASLPNLPTSPTFDTSTLLLILIIAVCIYIIARML